MEDDAHHFAVDLVHDGRVVTGIAGHPIRYPWSTCPGAVDRLAELIGTPVALPVRLAPAIDIHRHCTHLYDLGRLAIAQAARGGRRRYDIVIPDRIDGRTEATLWRDGAELLYWTLDGDRVTTPRELAGEDMARRVAWPDRIAGDTDMMEAALILRRGVMVAHVRDGDREPFRRGDTTLTPAFQGYMAGTCHVYQPERLADGRITRSWRDFTDRADDLLRT